MDFSDGMGGAQETGSSWMEDEGSSLDEKVDFHFYVPLPYITYPKISCSFSKSPRICSLKSTIYIISRTFVGEYIYGTKVVFACMYLVKSEGLD